MSDATDLGGVVVHWAHGKARVRLDDGRELPCGKGSAVRGQLGEGERVRVVVSPDGTAGRVVAREVDTPRERVGASERRRRKVADEGST